MEAEKVNSYAEAIKLNQTVVDCPLDTGVFISKLFEGAKALYADMRQLKTIVNSIELLEKYLKFKDIGVLCPDETFFEGVAEVFECGEISNGGKPYGKATVYAVTQDARRVMNRYFYPNGLIRRVVYNPRTYARYLRFLSLTALSQQMILWYEQNAKKLHSDEHLVINDRQELVKRGRAVRNGAGDLSASLNNNRVDVAIRFLLTIRKKGFEFVQESDIEVFRSHYRAKKQMATAERYLPHLYSFIGNCYLAGYLKYNIFQNCVIDRTQRKARIDFISEEGIKQILDMKTVDWTDLVLTRNRLICALGYDCGFRKSELAQVPVGAVEMIEGNLFRIRVDSFLQKGTKPTVYTYVLFPETAAMLKRYLNETRRKLKPKCNRLFLNQNGQPLSGPSVHMAVRKVCRGLGVKTFNGRTPSSHDLRHSLATLNIEPFGKKLSLVELQKRMRHTTMEVLLHHYVHNNPLAELKKHKELMKDAGQNNTAEALSYDQVAEWLSKIGVPAQIRKKVEYRYNEHVLLGQVSALDNELWIPESQAIDLLLKFSIKKDALRSYCKANNLCQFSAQNGKTTFLYKRQFIHKLVTEYCTRESLMTQYKWSRMTFYRKLKEFDILKIGHVLVVRRDSVFQE